jgi:hypothetical protein
MSDVQRWRSVRTIAMMGPSAIESLIVEFQKQFDISDAAVLSILERVAPIRLASENHRLRRGPSTITSFE